MTRTIQQAIYAAIPLDGDGVTMADLYLYLGFRLHKTSVQNAIARLRYMGLVVRVSRYPSRYRRASALPCPNDRRGRVPASHPR